MGREGGHASSVPGCQLDVMPVIVSLMDLGDSSSSSSFEGDSNSESAACGSFMSGVTSVPFEVMAARCALSVLDTGTRKKEALTVCLRSPRGVLAVLKVLEGACAFGGAFEGSITVEGTAEGERGSAGEGGGGENGVWGAVVGRGGAAVRAMVEEAAARHGMKV